MLYLVEDKYGNDVIEAESKKQAVELRAAVLVKRKNCEIEITVDKVTTFTVFTR